MKNIRLKGDNAGLEAERAIVSAEKSSLEKQIILLKRQMQTWKDRYKKTFEAKVAVEFQHRVSLVQRRCSAQNIFHEGN